MVAMRAQQFVMAEFLIDNGIDYNYETTLLVRMRFLHILLRLMNMK